MRLSIREALFSGDEVNDWDPKALVIPSNVQNLVDNNNQFVGWTFNGFKSGQPFTGTIKKQRGIILEHPDPHRVNQFLSAQANDLNNKLTRIVFSTDRGWVRLVINFWTIKIDKSYETIEVYQTPENLSAQASLEAELDRLANIDLLQKVIHHRDNKCTEYAEELKAIIRPGDDLEPIIERVLQDTGRAKDILDEQVRMNGINQHFEILAGKKDWVETSGSRLHYYRVSAMELFKALKPTDVIPAEVKAGLKEVLDNNATGQLKPEVISWIKSVI